jgi:quercetin dioxygenase-like cupin family protein
MTPPVTRYARPRVFVREVASSEYGLTAQRRQRLEGASRVVHTGGPDARERQGHEAGVERHIMAPGDETFRTQSLQAHYVLLPPGGRNKGHGHQNEAFFYIIEGRGFEMHDGLRYDWEAGDAVAVHNDCVHWHNNLDPDRRAVALVMKAKPLWLFLGLQQQGNLGTAPPPDDDRWGPAVDFPVIRDMRDETIPKVLKPGDTPWQMGPHGHTRRLAGEGVPLRVKAIDVHLQEIPSGSRSGRLWQMADEIFFVLEGRGYDLHWDVDVEITDRYYARIAKEPRRWEWGPGDLVYIPHNTIHQHFNADGSAPARFIAASNRIYQQIGYGRIEHLETAPEYAGAVTD